MTNVFNNTTKQPTEWYTTAQLAELLDVRPDWLRKNRKSEHPIPFKVFSSRNIRYAKQDIFDWIGRTDLSLRFYNKKTLAKKLGMSDSWMHKNRFSDNPIPFRHFGHLLRYNETEVNQWLRKNNRV